MKTIVKVFSVVFVFLSLNVSAQLSQERQVAEFTGVSLETFADVYITPGDRITVTVEADEPVVDKVITVVKKGVLHIETKGTIRSVRVMNVYVTMPEIDLLRVSGSGDISCTGSFRMKDVQLKVSGSGEIETDIEEIKNAEISIGGSGNISLQNVRGDFSASLNGSGDLEVDQMLVEKCVLSVSGSGDVELSGSCVDFTVSLIGSGDVDAEELKAVHATVEITGSGDCTLYAVDSISAVINGSGDLLYYGRPEKVNIVTNGTGEVSRK